MTTRRAEAEQRRSPTGLLPRILLAALALALGCGGTPRPAAVEWDRELPDGVRIDAFAEPAGAPGQWVVPVRVVDDATDEPVAGARISNWWETDTPNAEPWADLLEGEWTTDRDGFALVSSRENASWWFVEAPGYGPFAEMHRDEEYRLVRGVDFTLEVRDWLDRPMPGAVVEAFLGCGHTPTVRTARAGPDGRLVLPCIDPSYATDLWVRTPGIEGRNEAYWGDGPEGLPVRDGVHVIEGEPSPVLEGRVLRADGSPAAGARVGTFASKRGPWTAADSEGRYRLVGAPPFTWLVAMAPISDPREEGRRPARVEFQSMPGVFQTVELPERGRPWDEEAPPAPPESPDGPGVAVRIRPADEEIRDGSARVVLVRDGDGAAKVVHLGSWEGEWEWEIPVDPGTWTVTAGDPAGLFRPASRRVEVADGWTEVSFVLDENPTCTVEVLERTGDGATRPVLEFDASGLFLVTPEGQVAGVPTSDDPACRTIHVPAEGEFAIGYRASGERSARVALDGPPAAPGPTIVLPPPGEDEESFLDPEDEPESAPPPDFPAATLTVLGPDGLPAAGAEIHVESAEGFGRGWYSLDDEGRMERAFDRGDRVFVSADPYPAPEATVLPFEARIDGPGPWTLRWPTAEVAIRAVDDAGAALPEFTVFLGARDTLGPVDGVVRIRGLPPGPIRLWIAAPGRRSHDLRLVIREGERREVVVRMNRATGR